MSGGRPTPLHTLLFSAQGQSYLLSFGTNFLGPSANVYKVWRVIHLFIFKFELQCLIWSFLMSAFMNSTVGYVKWCRVLRSKPKPRTSGLKVKNCYLTYLLTYLLTPWSRVLLEKLTGSAASQEIPRILEPEGSSPYPQVPANCPYPEPTPSSPRNPLPLPEDPS